MGKVRKIKLWGRVYRRRFIELAERYIGGACRTCGSPLDRMYICQYCGDSDPTGPEEERDA